MVLFKTILDRMDSFFGWPRAHLIHRNLGDDYMERWTFWDTAKSTGKVHRILCSDGQHPHDHPYDFTVVLVWGSYIEEFFPYGPQFVVRRRVCKPFQVRRYKAENLHRLILEKPVWSLFLGKRRRHNWGFHVPQRDVKRLQKDPVMDAALEPCVYHASCWFVPWAKYKDVPYEPAERVQCEHPQAFAARTLDFPSRAYCGRCGEWLEAAHG